MFVFFFKNVYKTLLQNINLSLEKDLYGTLLKFFILFSTVLLCVDIFAEFLLNTNNCTICGYPRIPNYSVIVLYILNLKYKDQTFKRYAVEIAIFLMLIGFFISMYNTLLIYQILESNYNCYDMPGRAFYNNNIRDNSSDDVLYIYKYIADNNKCEFSSLMICSLPFVFWEGIVFLFTFYITSAVLIYYKKLYLQNMKQYKNYKIVALILFSFVMLLFIFITFFYLTTSLPIL